MQTSIGRRTLQAGGYAVASVALFALAGCGATPGGFLAPRDDQPAVTSDAPAARDVEAPAAFDVTDRGLWDGRPSLGGTWVAHPDVGQPERVIIRNTDNSKRVTGALFRRERTSPGPTFQVSSEAAAALGMLAGAPTQLSVTALRREPMPASANGQGGDRPAKKTDDAAQQQAAE